MRLADSGVNVDDGDPAELLSTGGGRTIKGGAPGGTVPAGMGGVPGATSDEEFTSTKRSILTAARQSKYREIKRIREIVCVLLQRGSGNKAPGSVGDSTGSRVSTSSRGLAGRPLCVNLKKLGLAGMTWTKKLINIHIDIYCPVNINLGVNKCGYGQVDAAAVGSIWLSIVGWRGSPMGSMASRSVVGF
ncbi:hypothetical protein ACLB2K_062917 [Fragaria x ananassa]